MRAPERPPAWRADLALAAVCFVWGATFIVVTQALGDIPTLMFLAVRFAIAAAILGLVVGLRSRARPSRLSIQGGIVAGGLLFLGYAFQTFGLRYTTAAKTGFITGLYIPLVPGLGALIYRKAPQLSEALGIVLAFAGMGLLSIPAEGFRLSPGDLLVACCAFAFALHILALGHYAKQADVGWLAAIQIAVAAVLAGATFWWAEPLDVRWTTAVWRAIAITSVFATALAFFVQTWAQRYTSATRAALIFALEPVFAWLTSYVVAGEVLTGRAGAGAALILGGILIAELKPFRWPGHQPLSGNHLKSID